MSWIPSYKKPGGGELEIVTWSEGTDEQIVAMLDAHYNGDINVHDYWAVGDTRVVTLNAIDVLETQPQQNITYVLSHEGGKYLSDGITECAFQVDLVNDLFFRGQMNSTRTNLGGWKDSERRTWCNGAYKNAIPSTLRDIFKEFINQSGTGNSSSSGVENTTDYFALRAEVEVFGTTSYSVSGEGSQVKYYETSSNRQKINPNYQSSMGWWERSPRSGNNTSFCAVLWDNSSGMGYANNENGIAPFGVI